VLLRLGIDLVLLHLSTMLAISSAAALYRIVHANVDQFTLYRELVRSYQWFAVVLAPIFLAILYLTGVYEPKAISLPLARRWKGLARAVFLGVLTCIAVNYFVFRNYLVARSVFALFFGYILASIILSRAAEEAFRPHFRLVESRGDSITPVDAPILVIGGAGYIGSMLCRKLLAEGARVRVLDSLVYGDFAIRDIMNHPRFELIQGDCRHIQSVVAAMKDVKAIAHLAAIVGDPACEQDKVSALEINYSSTRMLIEIARGHKIERLVFASSCSVYGATDEIMDENSAVLPISLYGQTKVDSERVLLEAHDEHFHPVILRLATVFGNGYRPRFDLLVNLLAARATQDGVITIYNENQWRPFIHVWDVACGFAAALQAPRDVVSGQIFNLGDNTMNFTLKEVAEETRRAFPTTEVKYIVNDDRRTYRVNFTKIRKLLGYQCTISLREGIAELRRALADGSVTDYNDLRYNNQKFLANHGVLRAQDEIDHKVMAAFADPASLRPSTKAA
jgi:nucleoside-diphosphate-sugar epimerase